MKALRHILVLAVSTLLFSGCSVLSSLAGSATTAGSNTGSALLSLFKLYQAYQTVKNTANAANSATYGIDLNNASNLINIGQVLTGASALTTNPSQNYTNEFSNAMINSSSNLVNQNNLGSVLSGLLSLGNSNTSALAAAAASAAAGQQTNVSTNTAGVSSVMSALGSLFSLLGN